MAEARKRLCLVEHLHGNRSQRKGIVDLLCCYMDRFFLVEVKTPTGSLEPSQIKFIEDVIKAGGAVPVITSVQEMYTILDEIKLDALMHRVTPLPFAWHQPEADNDHDRGIER